MANAGWYAAPGESALLRWFDGEQWTGHTVPIPPTDSELRRARNANVPLWKRELLPTPASKVVAGMVVIVAVVFFLMALNHGDQVQKRLDRQLNHATCEAFPSAC